MSEWDEADFMNQLAPRDPMPGEPLTELGYAHRLAHLHGHEMRNVPAWGKGSSWLVWDGKRWARDSTGQVARWAKLSARSVTDAAIAEGDKVMLAAARKAESSSSIGGCMTLAATDAAVVVTTDMLDADPFLLNCRNGTLDLRTMELREHAPADLITRIAGASYEPGAKGPAFDVFLARVQPEEDMRAYLSRLLGHSLEGRVSEHVMAVFHGDGRNGKGTLTNAVMAALGDYADAADPELLTARTFDAHPTSTADLFGMRLAVLHETDQGRRLAEGTVKRLTGGDRIKARRMREDFWHFEPSHTFLMLSNYKPLVGGTDEGIWSRLRLVPWPVIIPAEERDLNLGDKLALELEAVLAFLVRGYSAWRKGGLDDPPAVASATAAWKAESDITGEFIRGACIQSDGVQSGSSQLYHAFLAWTKSEGVQAPEMSNKTFSGELERRGFQRTRTNVGAVFHGIAVRETGEPERDRF